MRGLENREGSVSTTCQFGQEKEESIRLRKTGVVLQYRTSASMKVINENNHWFQEEGGEIWAGFNL